MEKNLKKPIFIAEIASSHNGSVKDLNNFIKKIDSSKSIDLYKIQIFKNNNLCHVSSPLYKKLQKIEIAYPKWKKILSSIRNKQKLILEPFDKKSFYFCKKLKKINKIKIPSAENQNNILILEAVKRFEEVYINVSGFSNKQILTFSNRYKKFKKKIIIMYGFQSYPTKFEDLRFKRIKFICNQGFRTGYADHSCYQDIGETYISVINALKFGAVYIEKHITPSIKKNLPDKISSFELKEFENLIKNFAKLNNFDQKKDISKSEIKYCQQMNKFAFTKNKIKKGEMFDLKKIIFLRSKIPGLSLDKINQMNKKKVLIYEKKIKKNSILRESFFKR